MLADQVSGIRYQVSGIRYQVSGIRYQGTENAKLAMRNEKKCKTPQFLISHFELSGVAGIRKTALTGPPTNQTHPT
jgi:hypothetical protein